MKFLQLNYELENDCSAQEEPTVSETNPVDTMANGSSSSPLDTDLGMLFQMDVNCP